MKTKSRGKSLIQRALETRIRELETQVEFLSDDNGEARKGWQRVYKAIYPRSVDGPHLGMHISGSIETILRGIRELHQRAVAKDSAAPLVGSHSVGLGVENINKRSELHDFSRGYSQGGDDMLQAVQPEGRLP